MNKATATTQLLLLVGLALLGYIVLQMQREIVELTEYQDALERKIAALPTPKARNSDGTFAKKETK